MRIIGCVERFFRSARIIARLTGFTRNCFSKKTPKILSRFNDLIHKDKSMAFLFRLSHLIDALNERVSKLAVWLVLLSCLVSAGNALIRYTLDISSNAWLELQWYMFAGIVMLGAAYTLKANEHVRVDVVYGRLQPRTRAWIDLLGMILFLMPASILIMKMSWPFFWESLSQHETSPNAGGLLRWPVKIVIPVGMGLIALQGLSEIIKRIGYLRGIYNMDTHYERPMQ